MVLLVWFGFDLRHVLNSVVFMRNRKGDTDLVCMRIRKIVMNLISTGGKKVDMRRVNK